MDILDLNSSSAQTPVVCDLVTMLFMDPWGINVFNVRALLQYTSDPLLDRPHPHAQNISCTVSGPEENDLPLANEILAILTQLGSNTATIEDDWMACFISFPYIPRWYVLGALYDK